MASVLGALVKTVADSVKKVSSGNTSSGSSSSSSTAGRTFKVQDNGKAPTGLSVGDNVVTGGGTYKITGVNSDGTYQSSLSNANQTTGNYTGSYFNVSNKTSNENKQGTIANTGTYADDLNKYKEAQTKAQVENLKAAKQKALHNLDIQEQNIKPMYQNQRNIVSANSQQGARNFAEYLANRGLSNSGAAAQGEMNRLSTLQNNMGNIGVAEANAYRDIENQKTAVENDYVSGLAQANAQIDAEYYKNLLAYNQQEREKIDALKQQAMYQYSDDYQARINELLAQGYDPNSREILQLQALRGAKVAQQNSDKAQYAIQLMQQGVGNANYLSNLTGLSVADCNSLLAYNKQMTDLALQGQQLNIEGLKISNAGGILDNKGRELQNQLLTKDIANYGKSSGGGYKVAAPKKNQTYQQVFAACQNAANQSENGDIALDKIANLIAGSDLDVEDGISIAKQYGMTVERLGRAMNKQGCSDYDIGNMINTYRGGNISDSQMYETLNYIKNWAN